MDRARPTLQVIVPAGWHSIPEGLNILRQHLKRKYGATVIVMPTQQSLNQPLAVYIGEWDPPTSQTLRVEVEGLLPQAFYSLAWMRES